MASAVIVNAVKGWGKTTLAAHADSAFLLAPLELGYLTLQKYGRVPERQYGVPGSWKELLSAVQVTKDMPAKVLVLDALDGFEQLCCDHVCQTEYGGDWGEHGFMGYQRGFTRAASEWKHLLQKLDELRMGGTAILILSHVQERTINNPMGKDFDRFVGNTHKHIWGLTSNWADAILFGMFRTIVIEPKHGKAKGIGGTDRILHCVGTDAYDAKNRFGMSPVIEFQDDHPELMWSTLRAAMMGGNGNAG